MHSFLILLAAVAGFATASRPKDVTICDYYTPIVTGKDNSPASQQELMLLITHTFILGNYTQPNNGIAVHGIAAPGTFNGVQVNMLPYFVGGYASTNDGGPHGVVKNFLDDGGAVPLSHDKPADGTHSNQYALLTHVYQYFGTFYGCTHQGTPEFPTYQGRASMYEVHKYMDLDKYETGWFNEQIVTAVASLGFEEPDVKFTNDSLYAVFGNRCSPPAAVIPPSAGPQLQAICVAPDCPLSVNSTCGAYPSGGPVEQPIVANATLVGNVTKENETAAAPTAAWPVHCILGRDGDSQSQTCSFASGSATGSASSTSTGTGGAVAMHGSSSYVMSLLVAFASALSVGGVLVRV